MTDIPTMAPNMHSQVQQTMAEHPEIDTMADPARAEVIDITAWRINGGEDRPWGRKARVNNPSDPQLNTDAMCYLRPDGYFEIYDVISGVDGSATWDSHGVVAPGENGYWWPPQPVEDQPSPEPTPPPAEDLTPRVVALEEQVVVLIDQVAALTEQASIPRRAHGPVDLPIVVESLTRMRAKGDIDVAVVEGEATPPNSSDDQLTVAEIVMLKKLLGGRP